MDFKDQVKQLTERVIRVKDTIQTEEATKTALVMPFLQVLGYDVFNPSEVVPEFISDIGTKKGEKVDYAIMSDATGQLEPCMLIECKHWKQSLTLHDNQLLRYFHVTKARFGILTNGIIYRFYTDLQQPNKMDEKPFLEINLLDLRDNHVEELKKFSKPYHVLHLKNLPTVSFVGVKRLLPPLVGSVQTLLSKPRQFALLAVRINLFVLKAARIIPGKVDSHTRGQDDWVRLWT